MKMDNDTATPATQEYFSTKEAARILGVSHRTLEDWRLKGGGPIFSKMGRIIRYHWNDIKSFCEACRYTNTGEAALAA